MKAIPVEQVEGFLTIAEKSRVKTAAKLIKVFRRCLYEWREFGKFPDEYTINLLMRIRDTSKP